MAVADRTTARNEMIALFRTAWLANVDSQNVELFFSDVKKTPPDTLDAFARITVTHALGEQATLANGTGNRKFSRTGLVTIQIFTKYGEGLVLSDKLAKVAVDAFEGNTTASGIWFRNVTANEIGLTADKFQVNVTADFTYDEIK